MGHRANKYNATRVVVDNHNFHSKAEARRYQDLRLLERTHPSIVANLKLQPRFRLHTNKVYLGDYVADFQYSQSGATVIEDVKGGPIPALSRWKIKHAEAEYKMKVSIVRMR